MRELYDPGSRDLSRGIREFGMKPQARDVAVVYYAGHGVQVERENYLIPADAKLERERDLLYEAMPLDRLLGEVSQASHIGIVLLDSCRNNPFVEKVARSMTIAGRAVSTTPGLARVDNVPRNTMVVMAAKADQIAEDGVQHSPFAAALLAHFQIPGLELSLFFRSVRDYGSEGDGQPAGAVRIQFARGRAVLLLSAPAEPAARDRPRYPAGGDRCRRSHAASGCRSRPIRTRIR